MFFLERASVFFLSSFCFANVNSSQFQAATSFIVYFKPLRAVKAIFVWKVRYDCSVIFTLTKGVGLLAYEMPGSVTVKCVGRECFTTALCVTKIVKKQEFLFIYFSLFSKQFWS